MPPFSEPILPLRSEVGMLILTQPFEQWTDLKNDLAYYRLNSSTLVSLAASFCVGKPSPWAEPEGPRPKSFLKSTAGRISNIYSVAINNPWVAIIP